MPPAYPSRFRTAALSRLRLPLGLTVLLLALSAASVGAQSALPLTAVVTDQTPLDLSDRFGIPAASGVDELGNFAFIGRGNSALFLRRAGSATIERLLQAGDPVPHFPGSRALEFSAPLPAFGSDSESLIAAGRVAFLVEFSTGDGLTHQAIMLYDGANFSALASSDEVAPGGGGSPYGWMTLRGLNDNGDVAFTATLSSTNASTLGTLFLVPFGSPATRIAGPGDTLPAPPGGFSPVVPYSIAFLALDNLGEIAFAADVTVFRASTAGIQALANGTPLTASLNDSGTMVFLDSPAGLRVATAAGDVSTVVPLGATAPPSIGGTLSPTLFDPAFSAVNGSPAINSAEDILFAANVSSSLVTTFALLRRRSDATLEVVAYAGQAAPGTAGTFASFGAVSLASDGKATFVASFAAGGRGVYEQTGTSAPVALAIDGQAAPVSGGGDFALFHTAVTAILDDGSTCFAAILSGGAASYAEFCGAPGSLTAVFDTDELLAVGSGVKLDVVPPAVGKPFVAFVAQRNGGAASLFVSNVTSAITTKLVTDGDSAPGVGGRILFASELSGTAPVLNASGEVAFLAATDSGGTAVFSASPTTGLAKIAASGEASPVAGETLASLTKPLLYPATSLNNAGQVAFAGTLSSGASAVFLYTPGSGIGKVVVSTDSGPSGTVGSVTAGPTLLSATGEVFFWSLSGYFVWSAGTISQVAGFGDVLPDGSTLGTLPLASFNDQDQVLFVGISALFPDRRQVLLLGAPNGSLDMVAMDGAATPAGGTFSVLPSSGWGYVLTPTGTLNAEGDLAFRAGILGGSADSGIFRRLRSTGVLEASAVQGQPLPGLGSLEAMSTPASTNALTALGPAGDVVFVNSFLNTGGLRNRGAFLSRPNGALGTILLPGSPVPGTSGVLSFLAGSVSTDDDGGLVLMAGAEGGSPQQAVVYADLSTFALRQSSAALVSSLNPAIGGESVTFTATVTGAIGGAPTGTVRFMDNGTQIGSGTLDGAGRATFDSSSLGVGSHSITAAYAGDFTFAASTSAAVTETVRAAAFGLPPGPMTVTAGQTVSIPLTLYAAAGSGLSLTLSVSGLPPNSSATFSANPVSPAAPPTGTTIQLILATQAASGGAMPPTGWPWWWPLGAAALGLAAFLRQMFRPLPRLRCLATATGLATFLLALLLLGCSGAGSGGATFSNSPAAGTPKGAATLTVTAASSSTTVTTDVPIVVQ